ncbi:MAG: hypothetical protein RIS47_548 [Bacteroidota bacterium]|jgi:putative redox protein
MTQSINLSWQEGMAFEGDINGHKILVDADPAVGGQNKGARPKPFMLLALAGCTGMDVVSILKKMRVEFDDLNIRVDGTLTEEHPKYYHTLHVVYQFWGTDLPLEKLEKAVNLSVEQYCGVMAVYKKTMEITTAIEINPAKEA